MSAGYFSTQLQTALKFLLFCRNKVLQQQCAVAAVLITTALLPSQKQRGNTWTNDGK